jgi:hypothetical protein
MKTMKGFGCDEQVWAFADQVFLQHHRVSEIISNVHDAFSTIRFLSDLSTIPVISRFID